jgi:hypothetical protein
MTHPLLRCTPRARRLPRILALLTTACLIPITSYAIEWKLLVDAGAFDRSDALVDFQAPAEMRGNYVLREGSAPAGGEIPLQIDASGRAVFIVHSLAKGARKSYSLTAAADLKPSVTVKNEGGVLKFAATDAQGQAQPIFHYQMEAGPVPEGVPMHFAHGAHLHPIYSPSGRVVTGNHPPDHRWHRGVWLAWTDTDFEGRHPDFWNMGKDKGALTGEVRFAALDGSFGGPVQGGFSSRHRFIDHTSGAERDVLAETWSVRATRLGAAFAIDLLSSQSTAGNLPLKLPKYFYGGLGVRGPAAWDKPDKVAMLTSNGDDRAKGDNSHAKWVHMGGEVDGKPTGVAVLIHPGNFRFPQPLRLNPNNPQLCVAPSQDGDWEIAPGKPYVSRYRLLVIDGAADPAVIDRAWNDYATPPVAELSRE